MSFRRGAINANSPRRARYGARTPREVRPLGCDEENCGTDDSNGQRRRECHDEIRQTAELEQLLPVEVHRDFDAEPVHQVERIGNVPEIAKRRPAEPPRQDSLTVNDFHYNQSCRGDEDRDKQRVVEPLSKQHCREQIEGDGGAVADASGQAPYALWRQNGEQGTAEEHQETDEERAHLQYEEHENTRENRNTGGRYAIAGTSAADDNWEGQIEDELEEQRPGHSIVGFHSECWHRVQEQEIAGDLCQIERIPLLHGDTHAGPHH